ncbi:ATP-binding protein [Deinococcus sp. QL22]|uniref:sensor histidine kinase n=1 Tax=Deinococcus sp. QL22 TaxID=2939437 RepID=UPI002016C0FE|nr:ATP-binding protein [Deinococcus sp. QL22]UQN08813.1 ATP-binding protein [Deinococcus sp. QL22]
MSDSGLSTPATLSDEVIRLREALAAAQQQNEVLSTFVALSEAAATTDDVTALARHVGGVLRRNIPNLLAVYFTCQGERWEADVVSDAVPPEFMVLLRSGLPLDTPFLAQTVAARTPQFFDHWNSAEQGMPYAEQFQAAGVAPFFQGHQPAALLVVGLVGQAVWTAQQRQLFTAVYRALYSAQQRKALGQEQQRALEAFMTLTEAIGLETDRVQLAERASELFLASMPDWSTGYYEWNGRLWRARHTNVPDPVLRDALFAGIPASTRGLSEAVETRGPVFFDRLGAHDELVAGAGSSLAAAFIPYFRDGQPVAMFAISSEQYQMWLPEDRALFEAVGRSLGLGLERAWQAQDLEEQRGELQAANEDLEAFAYSVSHDLRTPVRHVKGFTELGRRAMAQGQLDKVERAFQVMEGAADQMNRMIDAMLALSHSTLQPLAQAKVNLSALVDQARQDVADESGGRQIEWYVAPLPQVTGDAATLQQVLTNLLSNAVKFTRIRERAVIEIGAQAGDEAWTVWVRDNGVGFEPAYADRLFSPFQRLHGQSEFEGTGVGLATVRRIIVRHGGRIWADSVPGQGTTFSFTLPHVR